MAQIVDMHGQPIDMAAIREPQTARVAHLQREFESHPSRGLTPARLASIMVEGEQGNLLPMLDLADDMEERDAHLFSELSKRRGAVTSVEHSVTEPDNASADEKSITDQVRDWLDMLVVHANGMKGGLSLMLHSMTDAILKGFTPLELVWNPMKDVLGRTVLIPTVTVQPQRYFTLSADRRSLLLRTNSITAPTGPHLPAVAGEELKPFAWVMHMHPARNGYLARGALSRVLAWPYLFKNYSVRDLAEFLEIYGLPLRLGKYPTGASDSEKRALLQAVTQIGHNAAGIIPAGMMLEFQAAAAGTEVPFTAMWDRMDAAESKAILGQTLSASEGSKGSHALGKVHEQVRMDIRESDCERIADTIKQQLIAALVTINVPGANLRRLPGFSFDTGEAEDITAYSDALPRLVTIGMKIPAKWAHERLHIPEPVGDEPVLSQPAPPPAPVPPAGVPVPPNKPPAQKPAATDAQRTALTALLTGLATQQQPADLLDAVVAQETAQWRPLMAPIVEPLLAALDAAVANGQTLEQFASSLPAMIERMDSRPLGESLSRAAFGARLAGEADLEP